MQESKARTFERLSSIMPSSSKHKVKAMANKYAFQLSALSSIAAFLLVLIQDPTQSEFRAVGALAASELDNGSASLSTSSETPSYWHRPGCHQVGHTRTISIPGCVKFNLSTNACRGYCVSFSIPSEDDIGPTSIVSVKQLGDLLSGDATNGGEWAATRAPQPFAGDNVAYSPASRERVKKTLAGNNVLPGLTWSTSSGVRQPTAPNKGAKPDGATQLLGAGGSGQRSPLADAIGDTSVKRDVVSVGQCCSMMETEEVTINLRCGVNETRRLVFKSAKTCECFFCKQV